MAKRARVIELPVTGAVERPQPQPEKAKPRKVVEPSEQAIRSLPANSGEWSVANVPGLLVWIGKHKRSYRLVRRIGGKLKKITLQATTLSAARRESARVWNQLKPSSSSRVPTLREAVEQYIASRRLAPSTITLYRRIAKLHLLPVFGARRLDSLSANRAELLAHFARIEREIGRGAAFVASSVFNAVYQWQARLHDLPPNPLRSYQKPKITSRDWSFTPEELARWWQEVKEKPPMHRTFLLCALLTGARCGSLLHLTWRDISFEEGTITFRVTKRKPYTVPMSDRLRSILLKYRDHGWPENESGLLFPSLAVPGKPKVSLRHANPIRGMHALRHTARSYLARLGAPVEISMVLLGHAFSGAVTFGYVTTSVLLEPARAYSNKLAEEFARICGFDDAE
jgi:integrase